MRVLHVLRSDGFAGVERHIATLAGAQARSGHTVAVIGGDPHRMNAALGGTPVRVLSGNTVGEVLTQVRRHRGADVVHAHMTAGELAAALSATAPLVVTRHFARSRGATRAGRLAGRIITRRVQAQMAISRFVADAVDGEATVVYPGVPAQEMPASTKRRQVVLVVQRLQPEKRTAVALRAFAAAARPGWTLEVVGRGPEEASLRELARALGVADRVSFLGFRDDVPDRMRSSAVLLAPCEVEGLGLSVLEAMAHGLPVVASRAGAHLETVGRTEDARLFEPGGWRHAGDLLADLLQDPGGRDGYGARLAEVQRSIFTPQAQVAGTDAVYQEVLG